MEPHERLKSIRVDKGITTYELADLTGIPQSTISKMENGKRKIETDSLQLLAKALNVPISTFFDDDNSELNTATKSESEEKFHSDIVRIERARRKMPKDEQENMMKVLEAAFGKYFND
ncbi:helix-turn-helix domain-containing protein [Clostridium nigeriense]|uniref:helix-turn-helix domain-containing protein n=1 Tax=Clostridium nigeriense TaxID=1805470 RepID=UPI003D32D964